MPNRLSIQSKLRVLLLAAFLFIATNNTARADENTICAQLLFSPNLDRTPIIAPLHINEIWDSFMFLYDPGATMMENWPNNWNARFVRLWDPEVSDYNENTGPGPDSLGYGKRRIITNLARWEFDSSCGTIPNSAGLAAQGHDLTVYPGQKVRIWHNVSNTGTNTWSASNGYGWKGINDWASRAGEIWRDVTPGTTLLFEEEIIAPDSPGRYYYGFILTHNGSNFGPIYMTRVTVRQRPELLIQLNATVAWSLDCNNTDVACMPIQLSYEDLPAQWQAEALFAASMWREIGTKLRFTTNGQSKQTRILIPNFPPDCIGSVQPSAEIKLAVGEIRILPMSKIAPISCNFPIGIPYVDRNNPEHIIAGLVLLPDNLDTSRYDLRTLIAHELGHTLGFCHQLYPNCETNGPPVSDFAVMRAADWRSLFGLSRKVLHADDLAWLTHKFGDPLVGDAASTPQLIGPSRLTPHDLGNLDLATQSSIKHAPDFTWSTEAGTDTYVLQLSTSAAFDEILYSTVTAENNLPLSAVNQDSTILQPFQTYFWRVQSTNSYGNSDWSTPWELRTSTHSCGTPFDASCDGQVSLADYEVWRQEFIGILPSYHSDFDNSGTVDLLDFSAWKNEYGLYGGNFTPGPNLPASSIMASFEISQTQATPDGLIEANVYLDTQSDANVSIASIALRYPLDLLEFVGHGPCESNIAQAVPALSYAKTSETDSPSYSVLTIVQAAHMGPEDLPSGRFCFVTLQFRPLAMFTYPQVADISLDTDLSWEIIGEQTDFLPLTSPQTSRLEVTMAPEFSAPYIHEIGSTLPNCVLRQPEAGNEQQLLIIGQNLPTSAHHLQFRRVDTHEESIHFGLEVNWESDTQVSLSMDLVNQHLWADDPIPLQVRLTSLDYFAVSNWSPMFWLASNHALCPGTLIEAKQQLMLPMLLRESSR